MKLSGLVGRGRWLALVGACAAAAAATVVASQGCSSSSGGGTPGPVGAQPPANPGGPPTTVPNEEHNFGLHVLFLGDTDRQGVTNPSAWKSFGFNLDGKISTATSNDVCQPQPGGGGAQVHENGNNGIDNSFGHFILPIIQAASSDASKRINDSINQGSFTVMFDVFGLSDATLAQTATGLTGNLLAGSKFPGTPTWTKADDWPVNPALLTNTTDPRSAVVKFGAAYVVNGTFVAGSPSDVKLSLSVGGVEVDLTVHAAIIVFDHTAVGQARNGTIAGVINTTELIASIRNVAGRISQSLCASGTFDNIAKEISGASDVVLNGSTVTQDPKVQCNAISIGLGFNADEIGPPHTIAPPPQPSPDPCAQSDAGPDSSTGDDGSTGNDTGSDTGGGGDTGGDTATE